MIDLRSDTVTVPSQAMRTAMASADVGDDVFGEDPTVNALQIHVAGLLGKEAALFVPSGQMGNQLAIKAQTRPADEVILADNCHIVHYESAASGVLSGVQLATVDTTDRGYPTAEAIESKVRSGAYWEPQSRLISLENTINRASGMIFPQSEIQEIGKVAKKHGLKLHLDGARLWNAAIALNESVANLVSDFDTVTVCLSKGLGAPVGSVLAGDTETIKAAHRYRKMFGAGMRQVGFLASAGQFALDHNLARLKDDHDNAQRLAHGLSKIPGIQLDHESVQTNILIFELLDKQPEDVLENLARQSVQMIKFGPRLIRATTHLGISESDIDEAISAVRQALSA